MSTGPICRICGNVQKNRSFVAFEMMFGSREQFSYIECSACGCLQICEIPPDLGRHYADRYYSLGDWTPRFTNSFANHVRRKRAAHAFGTPNLFGWLASKLFGPVGGHRRWFEIAGVGFGSTLLDVGCGSGALLGTLHVEGFRWVTGVDPFAPSTVELAPGFRIIKGDIHDVVDRFDLVMMNHSLEHIPDQLRTLKGLHSTLARGGTALVRIPLAGTWAWRTYGVDWVQLDAPRHLYLHTDRSFRLLANEAGFDVFTVEHDSTEFQFWGSEQYQSGIPLLDPRSQTARPRGARLKTYRDRARALNLASDGDQACYYLRPR